MRRFCVRLLAPLLLGALLAFFPEGSAVSQTTLAPKASPSVLDVDALDSASPAASGTGTMAAMPSPPAATAVPSSSAVATNDPSDPIELPTALGLPIVVRVALAFVEVKEVDENEGGFTATVDLRLSWRDPRLAFDAATAPRGYLELRGDAAEEKLTQIWNPELALSNLDDEPSYQSRGLRLFPDGDVVLMQRTTGSFGTAFEVERFPFDRQRLEVAIESRDEPANRLVLDYRQPDVDFSRAATGLEIDGFTPGLVALRRDPAAGWNGTSQSRVWASLQIARDPTGAVAPIFIPLFASLLIPFLSLWLNRVEDGELQVEAFELTNIIIGGLFALIALNFTVNAEYSALAAGQNTVKWLFGLNYLALAMALMINVLLFRFQIVRRWFGKYVQEQVFLFLIWAVPLLVLGTAAAILVSAWV